MRQWDLRKRAQYLRHVIINIVPPSYFTICFCAFTDTISLGRLEREPYICCLTQVLAAAPDTTTWLILHSRVPTMQLPRRCFFASWWVRAECWPQFLRPAAKMMSSLMCSAITQNTTKDNTCFCPRTNSGSQSSSGKPESHLIQVRTSWRDAGVGSSKTSRNSAVSNTQVLTTSWENSLRQAYKTPNKSQIHPLGAAFS